MGLSKSIFDELEYEKCYFLFSDGCSKGKFKVLKHVKTFKVTGAYHAVKLRHSLVYDIYSILRGYCTPGPCIFSKNKATLDKLKKYTMGLIRNVPRNSKITFFFQ